MPMLITPFMSLGLPCRLPELYVSLRHLRPSSRRSTNIGRRFFSRLPRQDRLVVTLRPEKMEAVNQDVADITGRKRPIFRCMPHKGIIGMAIPTTTAESPVGVLYYYDQPDLSGGLRFRLCHSVANFGDGRDLEVDVGEPWHVPLYSLIRTKHWQPIRALLLDENLVDEGLVSDIMRLPSLRRTMCSRILHTIGQPFLMDLHQKTSTFMLMNRKHMYSFALQGLLYDRASKCQPYEGRVLVKFEKPNLEGNPKKTLTFTLRVLEALTPIRCVVPDYDQRIAPPKPGELISKVGSPKGVDYKPWTLRLDDRTPRKKHIAKFL